jgi:fused signal recognition particle receptor
MFSWLRKKGEQAGEAAPAAPVTETAVEPTRAPENEQTQPADAEQGASPKSSWLQRLKAGLSRTRGQLVSLFTGRKIDEAFLEELETTLLMADCGIEVTETLMARIRERIKRDRLEAAESLRQVLADELETLLAPLEAPLDVSVAHPFVIMVAGVNGAGKTTSIGKLARWYQAQGKKVMLAAGDTFRAAAREQLVIWGERNGVPVIAQEKGDPAAVAFDAVQAAKARGYDVLIVDTAGRLPTQLHLMEEIAKVRRVIQKAEPTAPHEVLLVLDANIGQNAIAQAEAFDKAIGVTGFILTKLDGTAKGGVIAALAKRLPKPVRFVGVGEGVDDLRPFVARDFVAALVGLERTQ